MAAQAKKDTPEWAKNAVEEVKAAKVMNGDDTGAFRPESTVKRGELAQTIVNYTNSELLADRVEEIVEDVLENRSNTESPWAPYWYSGAFLVFADHW